MDKALEEEYDTSIVSNIEDSQTFYKLYDKSSNTLSNILTKYEKTKVIFARLAALSLNLIRLTYFIQVIPEFSNSSIHSSIN